MKSTQFHKVFIVFIVFTVAFYLIHYFYHLLYAPPNYYGIIQQQSACPVEGSNLNGPLKITFESPSFQEIAKKYPQLKIGGLYEPIWCMPRFKVAIIIPYRNREIHLRAFIYHIHSVLQHQLLKYGIFVVEQIGIGPFNRGILMNIGFKESNQLGNDWDFFIFHDVDLLIEDDRAFYICPNGPLHMASAVDIVRLNG